MNKFTLVLAAMVVAMGAWLMGSGNGYAKGFKQGALSVAAKRDADLVGQLSATITASNDLAGRANVASQALRQSVGDFETNYQPVIKEFNDALTQTAASRTGCVFSPGVMRQLGQAQQRAATAAAKGLSSSNAGAVQGAAASAGKPR